MSISRSIIWKMSVLCLLYGTLQHIIFHFSKPTLENERPSQTVQHFSIPHLLKLSIRFILFITVFHCDKSSGLRLHNGMMSSRKIYPKTVSRSQTAQRYDEPSKNTHHNSGVLNIQRHGMEALGSSGGALGDLWGALESSGGALGPWGSSREL